MKILLFFFPIIIIALAGCQSGLSGPEAKQKSFEDLISQGTCETANDCELVSMRADGCCQSCDQIAISKRLEDKMVAWDQENCTQADYEKCSQADCAKKDSGLKATCRNNKCAVEE